MDEGMSEIDRSTLLAVVREATDRPLLTLEAWSEEPIQGGAGRSPGVRRLSGQATDGAETVNWSLVLKMLGHDAGSESPESWSYWRREVDAYESGFLDDLPGSLRAPRSFGTHEFEPRLVGLWLEDVVDAAREWSMADFAAAASSLGELNGAYASGLPLPESSWLSRDWLRRYVEYSAPMVDLLERSASDRWVREWFPPDVLETTLEIWTEREWCFGVLARLPQTVCHMDASNRNLFRRSEADGDISTVAIDWAFVGRGAIGEELGPLAVASVGLGEVDFNAASELERSVLEGYLDGLSRSGFECDERLVRLGYAVAGCLRYAIGTLEALLPTVMNEQRHAWLEQVFGMSRDEICAQMVEFRRSVLRPLLGEARAIERELELL
jgi:hypothetical protein